VPALQAGLPYWMAFYVSVCGCKLQACFHISNAPSDVASL